MAGQPIEADPDVGGHDDDGNDAGGDSESLQSSTASITSSLLEYRTIHGRTYQSSQTTEYWAPNDKQHLEAFDVAHQWITMMFDDKLFIAPIGDNPQQILDIGTGSAIWPIDMGDMFPNAQAIIGTDISPTQPSWAPPNVSFQIDDAQRPWTFKPDTFDFIHIRYMHAAIDDWDKLYAQVFKALKPGGWFQHLEPNIELRASNPDLPDEKGNAVFREWAQVFYDARDKLGRTFRFDGEVMTGWARNAGFDGITHRKFVIPHGGWPKDKRMKEMGMYTGLYMDMSLDGFALYPIGQVLGWSLEEVMGLVARMRAAIKSPKTHTVSDVHVVYGQKPQTAAE